ATHVLYRGEYQRAFALASEYLESHPDSLSGRILVARAEIAQGKYTAAYDRLRKTLELDPTDLDALYYLNQLCTILSQIELRRLIEPSPASYRAHQVMA